MAELRSREELLKENEILRRRLSAAEEILDAIRNGKIDAVLVNGTRGNEVYTLQGADYPYRVMVEAMNEGAATLSPECTILYCNRQFSEMLRLPPEKIAGGSMLDFVVQGGREKIRKMLERAFQGDVKGETYLKTGDDKEIQVVIRLRPSRIDGMRLLCMLVTDLTERKKSEQAIKASNRRLIQEYNRRKYLSKKLVDILESDRRELAVTLHDLAGQHLAAIKMDLEAAEGQVEDEIVKGRIRAAIEKTLKVFAYVKNTIRQLRPSTLDDMGLIPSLKNLMAEMEEYGGVKIHFFHKGSFDELAIEKGLAIFRILQECLNNVIKHAQAKEAFINLIRQEKDILLTVEDDGRGFDYDQTRNIRDFNEMLGITIMKERAAQMDGELRVESQPGKGTVVMAKIPF